MGKFDRYDVPFAQVKSGHGTDCISARGAFVSAQDFAYVRATVLSVAGASRAAEGGGWNGTGGWRVTRDEEEKGEMAAAPGASPAGSETRLERQQRHARQPRGGGGGGSGSGDGCVTAREGGTGGAVAAIGAPLSGGGGLREGETTRQGKDGGGAMSQTA